jgi:hypothetical protein
LTLHPLLIIILLKRIGIKESKLTMNKIALVLYIGLFTSHTMHSMQQKEMLSIQLSKGQSLNMLNIMLMRFEKKKLISDVTVNSFIYGSPRHRETLLTEILPEDLTTFSKLDYKERIGAKLDHAELLLLESTITKILTTTSLALCEMVQKKTTQQLAPAPETLAETTEFINFLYNYSLITPCIHKIFSTLLLKTLVEDIKQEREHLLALETCITLFNKITPKRDLDSLQKQSLDASIGHLMSLRTIKAITSITKVLKQLNKQKKILPETFVYLENPDHLFAFYKYLSPTHIDLFITWHTTLNIRPQEVMLITKKIVDCVRTFMAQERKKQPSDFSPKSPKTLSEEELEKALEDLHLKEYPGTSITPRSSTISPNEPTNELIEEIALIRLNNSTSPAIMIKPHKNKHLHLIQINNNE